MDNLEHFPASLHALRMLRTVSPVYSQSYFVKWLYQVMGEEFDEAWQFFEELRYQAYPETCTWTISFWERMYHIPEDPTLILEDRRSRLKAKRNSGGPFNPAVLELLVETTYNNTLDAQVEEHIDGYTFALDILVDYLQALDGPVIVDLVRKKIPSHLAFLVRTERSIPHKLHVGQAISLYRQETVNAPDDFKLNMNHIYHKSTSIGTALTLYKEETVNSPDFYFNPSRRFTLPIGADTVVTTYKEVSL